MSREGRAQGAIEHRAERKERVRLETLRGEHRST
jgi:hypothetical protein